MAEGVTAPGVMLLPGDRAGWARPWSAGFIWATVSLMIFSGWFVITRFRVTHELRIWDIMALRFGVGAALLGPSAATAIIALLPAVASILAIPVLGEVPLPAQWAAIVAIGIGVCLAAKRQTARLTFPNRPA
jgi:drug/metabolite transporter (DMT)-like permease